MNLDSKEGEGEERSIRRRGVGGKQRKRTEGLSSSFAFLLVDMNPRPAARPSVKRGAGQ